MIQFEWDENKNTTNKRKHQVSFEEAATVFFDENALLISDDEHSEEEDRYVIIGMSVEARLIVVCHCYRNNEKIIRIISARKATKNESLQYARGLN